MNFMELMPQLFEGLKVTLKIYKLLYKQLY